MNDSNFGLHEQGLGLRQGDDPLLVTTESKNVLEDTIHEQPAIRKSSLDTTLHDVPLLAFHRILDNEDDESNADLDPAPLQLEAQIGGRIKLPDQRTGGGSTASDLNELTFYRRNLFKVNARVCLPREGATTLVERGLVSLIARLDSIESIEGETVKLIRIPIKNDVPGDDSTAKGEPVQPILLDHKAVDASGQVTLDICWDRLQFRRATTKTRGSAAQRYQLRVTVVAVRSDQSERVLARVASEFIVVRGRSPKNYPDQTKGQYFPAKLGSSGVSPPVRQGSISKSALSEFQQDIMGPQPIVPATNRGTSTYFSSRQSRGAQPLISSGQGQTKAPGTLEITDLDLYSDGSEGSSSTEMPASSVGLHNFIPPMNVDVATKPVGPKTTGTQNWLALREVQQPLGGLLLPSLCRQTSKTATLDSKPTTAGEQELESYEYIPLSINDWSAPVDPVYVSITEPTLVLNGDGQS